MSGNKGAGGCISVIVPAYNVAKYIGRCIESVLDQSHEDLELILIDDGSVDGTGSICDEYAAADPRVRVIHKANAGVAEARNTALEAVRGEMIAFADADDHMEPDMLARLYEVMVSENADLVSCGYYEEYSDRTELRRMGSCISVLNKREAYEDYFRMGGRLGSGCWNKLYKTEVFKDIRYKRYVTGEDVELLCRVIDKCNKVVCIEYAGYHYVHREDSASRKPFGPANIDVLRAADDIIEYMEQNHGELKAKAYAFHAAWYSAQIQVMYLQKDVSVYSGEKKRISAGIRKCLRNYLGNGYVSGTDIIYIVGFMLGCYRPVKALRDLIAGK